MNERIRELRKAKGLNQTEFGQKIGVSQNVVSAMEKSGGTVTERNIKAICAAYNVNPEWLKNGTGQMFLETREAIIQTVAAEYELLPEEVTLMRMYLDLPAEHRAGVIEFAKKFVGLLNGQEAKRAKEVKAEDLHARLDEQIGIVKQGGAKSSVSSYTNVSELQKYRRGS